MLKKNLKKHKLLTFSLFHFTWYNMHYFFFLQFRVFSRKNLNHLFFHHKIDVQHKKYCSYKFL